MPSRPSARHFLLVAAYLVCAKGSLSFFYIKAAQVADQGFYVDLVLVWGAVQVLIALTALPLNVSALGGHLTLLRDSGSVVFGFLLMVYVGWFSVTIFGMKLDLFGSFLPLILVSPLQIHKFFLYGRLLRRCPERMPRLVFTASLALVGAILALFMDLRLSHTALVLLLAVVPLVDYPFLLYAGNRRGGTLDEDSDAPVLRLSVTDLTVTSVSTNSVQVALQVLLWLVKETHNSATAYALALAYQVRVVPMLGASATNQLIVRQPAWALRLLSRWGPPKTLSALTAAVGLIAALVGVGARFVVQVDSGFEDGTFFFVLATTGVVAAMATVNSVLFATRRLGPSAVFSLLGGCLLVAPFLAPMLDFSVQWSVSTLSASAALYYWGYQAVAGAASGQESGRA